MSKLPDIQCDTHLITPHGFAIEAAPNQQCQGVVELEIFYPETSDYQTIGSINIRQNALARVVIHHHKTIAEAAINFELNIVLENGAHLELVEIVETEAKINSKFKIQQKRNSHLTLTTIDIANRSLNREQHIELQEKGCECNLNGLFIISENQTCENHVKMEHAAGECVSNQLFKGIAARGGIGLFAGHILVGKDSQKTAAYQQNHNIILDDVSKIQTRPWLEIYADDVKCNHGATIGKLDPEAIYYMRQRGISTSAARRLQLEGFAEDVLKVENIGELQGELHQKIAHRIATL